MQRNMSRYGYTQLSVQNNFCLDFVSDKPCCNAIDTGVTGHQKAVTIAGVRYGTHTVNMRAALTFYAAMRVS
jgi:hypothetical protein